MACRPQYKKYHLNRYLYFITSVQLRKIQQNVSIAFLSQNTTDCLNDLIDLKWSDQLLFPSIFNWLGTSGLQVYMKYKELGKDNGLFIHCPVHNSSLTLTLISLIE